MRPSFAEPPLTADLDEVHPDPLAPMPALAIGWRLPDPAADLPGYLDATVAADLLGGGESARLHRRLVDERRLAHTVAMTAGLVGGPLQARDPDVCVLTAFCPSVAGQAEATTAEAITAVVATELEDLAEHGPGDAELGRATRRLALSLCRTAEPITTRTGLLGQYEMLYGRAELVGELPDLVRAVSAERVRLAAAELASAHRATLRIQPGKPTRTNGAHE